MEQPKQDKQDKKKRFWNTLRDIAMAVGQMVITALIDRRKKK